MYGIFILYAYMWVIFMANVGNVGKYSSTMGNWRNQQETDI